MSTERATDVLRLLVFSLAWSTVALQARTETVEQTGCNPNRGGLQLSPMIQAGQIAEAKRLSRVDLSLNFSVGESYAGYITSNETLCNHLFFWLFKSTKNDSAPLLVWLNTGPGGSAMVDLMDQNGPLRPNITEDERTVLIPRDVHWTEQFSVVYIDTSEGVGASFTDRDDPMKTRSSDYVAEGLFVFLQQFYLLFNEFQERPLYIGGERFAGRHGIFMGAPVLNAAVQYADDLSIHRNFGTISKGEKDSYAEKIAEYQQLAQDGIFNISHWEVIMTTLPWQPFRQEFKQFTTTPDLHPIDIRKSITEAVRSIGHSIHINQPGTYEAFNDDMYRLIWSDFFKNYGDELKFLMGSYKVLIYTSDYSVVTTNAGVENVIVDIPWVGQNKYMSIRRQVWTRGSGQNKELCGYYNSVRNFCRVIVHGAREHVSKEQPESMLKVISDFVQYGCLRP